MNLLELSEEELRVFFEDGIPFNFLRDIYINNNKLAQKLKGFRPNKATKQVLVNTSYSLIKLQKDIGLIGILTKFYNDYNQDLLNNKAKLIEKGYTDSMAYAKAINDGLNKQFMPIYFKLEHISNDEQNEILSNISLLNTIDSISTEITTTTISDFSEKNNKIINDLKKDNESSLDTLRRNVTKLQEQDVKANKEVSDIKKQINDLKNSNIQEKVVEDKLNQLSKKINKDVDEKISGVVKSDAIKSLQSQIDLLQKQIENLKSKNDNKGYKITKVGNEEYEIFDDYLHETIGDIIEKIASGNKFDVLREYLKEILFSKKPIITSEKNSLFLADILSSIITGGNYYIIDLNGEYDELGLLESINNCEFINENKVFLIRNKINTSDYRNLLNYIKERPYNEKYIFEISYDKEIQFLPPEIINDFNFFIGNFDNRSIDYKCLYSFENENRKSITNSEYDKIIDELNIDLDNRELMNVKFYGLLSFSHIPFKAIHDDEEKNELVDKIMNQQVRLRCEVILDD